MNHQGERRASGTTRVPFEAMVEVGGELGPSFEARAIDISEEGMHLRTAYLPEIGQPLVFRFDAGPGRQVTTQAEVTWKQEEGKGGEFGARFTSLDGEAMAALGRILGLGGPQPMQAAGSRVRLHIEGLASPMRARVKVANGTEITAFSELGFLQVGKQLELEDAQSGKKRPACIDRVEVEVDRDTHVPQLVVTLRYDDVPAHAIHQAEAEGHAHDEESAHAAEEARELDEPEAPATHGMHARRRDALEHEHDEGMEDGGSEHDAHDAAPEQSAPADGPHASAEAQAAPASPQPVAPEDPSLEEMSGKMRGALSRGAAKVGPAFAAMMTRAKVTMALLAAKRNGGTKDDVAVPFRRTTAPPPGGALHASGRKVVRSEPELDLAKEEPPMRKFPITKRRAIVGGAVGVAVLLAFVALKKPAPQAPLANAPPPETVATSVPLTPAPLTPPGSDGLTPTLTSPLSPPDPMSLSPAAKDDKEAKAPKKKVASFGNGPVAHGNTLHLKMDGAIEKLEGASQPNGFTVVIPTRRSLEAAGPLAARDSRIASIHVSNEANGAELTVAFKDGVPNYQVRAHGDTLEIALAPIGQVNDGKSGANHAVQAKHQEGGAKPHGKSHKSGASKHD